MNRNFLYIIGVITIPVIIFMGVDWISKSVSDYSVIEPESGVKCVVVSRMFNTSVDCWKVEKPYLRGG